MIPSTSGYFPLCHYRTNMSLDPLHPLSVIHTFCLGLVLTLHSHPLSFGIWLTHLAIPVNTSSWPSLSPISTSIEPADSKYSVAFLNIKNIYQHWKVLEYYYRQNVNNQWLLLADSISIFYIIVILILNVVIWSNVICWELTRVSNKLRNGHWLWVVFQFFLIESFGYFDWWFFIFSQW